MSYQLVEMRLDEATNGPAGMTCADLTLVFDSGAHKVTAGMRFDIGTLHSLVGAIDGLKRLLAEAEKLALEDKRRATPLMNEERAREILGAAINQDGSLCGVVFSAPSEVRGPRGWLEWVVGEADATIDTSLSADELEAIAWWMRNNLLLG